MAFPSLSGTPLQGLTQRSATSFGSASQPSGAPPHRLLQPSEGDHQLEKLEFALAVALTKGDEQRAAVLRQRILELGGNSEEPGT
ncbi:hypothetical protein VB716_16315 [Synechococcus sp. CCY9201]|uniref:hypothetical protein n=1 Tax=unclassified Synechococcus TaxID=2626047 RepID=UPI0018CCF4D6|nr:MULTISPECIES: hypothetical protein [unclassified Synechococcus]MEA5423463.1 hypothetical protein [Synechococcus sp. CCY9202]MEA5475782.1 hypothetical protein [Synechococcus sp. CCY9201]QPN61910.1 hypothetical protein H8F24_05175 [Synechococcus sp. CBW1002]QPN68771.1 hypothetical protein H8F26_04875 [Synechococcus sp. CBW1006]CAK6687063.1 hypothetical protein IFHNHDMJ_00124 [Synechococcus sp. CBW1107]